MDNSRVIDHIVNWLKTYCDKAGLQGFVLGISGGIDSALTSTLCAKTGKDVWVLSMPIYQAKDQLTRAHNHIKWLKNHFSNVHEAEIDLSPVFQSMETHFPKDIQDQLTMANTRSRLRMLTLYAYAGNKKLLVAGTGNKVEDFGVGFFTKYGDGGVDLSPIADLVKTEVWSLAKTLGVLEEIIEAKPTDGLWGDNRSDEDQIGASYPELEWAMEFSGSETDLTERQKEVLLIYRKFNRANQHKMHPIPVCLIPGELRNS
ncbi:MAG: NAD(+) synthase [Bacteroidota bacterium]